MGKDNGPLTEPMFYVLMALLKGDRCGTEIAEFAERRTSGRVRLGPGTLYTLLARFLEDGCLMETAVEGRKRTYRITSRGMDAYQAEISRLTACLQDAEAIGGLLHE